MSKNGQPLPEPAPRTPAEIMLPNPHMIQAEPTIQVPEVDELYVASLNAEQRALKAGVAPEALPLYGNAIRHAREARMRTSDDLTGLLNREGLALWFEREKPEKFGVFFADGDNFGEINKKYGHNIGDGVINFIGGKVASKFRVENKPTQRQLRSHPEDTDAVGRNKEAGVGRYGGDEFIGVADFTHVSPDEEQRVLELISGRLNDFGTYQDPKTGLEIPVSISAVGMVGHASDNQPLDFYKDQLDTPLQQLKQSHKDQP